jgi:hypothetical protein
MTTNLTELRAWSPLYKLMSLPFDPVAVLEDGSGTQYEILFPASTLPAQTISVAGLIYMRSTGLKDHPGRGRRTHQIFEGDILEIETRGVREPERAFYVVKWESKTASFGLYVRGRRYCGFPIFKRHKIIGNIYEEFDPRKRL